MPVCTSDIILDWMREDGYALGAWAAGTAVGDIDADGDDTVGIRDLLTLLALSISNPPSDGAQRNVSPANHGVLVARP